MPCIINFYLCIHIGAVHCRASWEKSTAAVSWDVPSDRGRSGTLYGCDEERLQQPSQNSQASCLIESGLKCVPVVGLMYIM
jgi:hypothetical protein